MPDAPTVQKVQSVGNYPGYLDVLTVHLTPPASNGSGKEEPYAQTGKILKYIVTAVPASSEDDDDELTTEGEGVLQADGTVSCCCVAGVAVQLLSLCMCDCGQAAAARSLASIILMLLFRPVALPAGSA